MIELEEKIVKAWDLFTALQEDEQIPTRMKGYIEKHLTRLLQSVPYHHHHTDANELAGLFRDGTHIRVRMRFADDKYTEQHWNEDYGVWGDGTYNGITRGVVGDCTVETGSIFIPAKYGIKDRYDVEFTVYEPKYSEKLRRRWAEEHGQENKD